MSSWASNPKDKLIFENWRSYLNEQKRIPIFKTIEDMVGDETLTLRQGRALLSRVIPDAILTAKVDKDSKAKIDISMLGIEDDNLQKVKDNIEKLFNQSDFTVDVVFDQDTQPRTAPDEPTQPQPQQNNKQQSEPKDTKTEKLEASFKNIMNKYIYVILENGGANRQLKQVKEAFKNLAEVIPLIGKPMQDNDNNLYFSDTRETDRENPDKRYHAYAIKFGDKTYLMPNLKRTLYFGLYFDFSPMGVTRHKEDEFGEDFVFQKLPIGFINDSGKFQTKEKGKLMQFRALPAIGTRLNEVKSMIAEIRNIIKQTRRLNEEE